MRRNGKLVPSLALLLAILLVLGGCAPSEGAHTPAPTSPASPSPAITAGNEATPAPTPTPTPSELPEPDDVPDETPPTVRVAMLKGPTGMGAAKLMEDAEQGLTQLSYDFTVAAAPDELTGKLVSGELDIAALPTNVAASLYAKTDGGVRLLCLNTLGVLYILENGESVQSISDLQGKTLYATGQGANPEYILNYLLTQNGLTPGEDVTIQWKTSDELTALMASGEIDLCMLPVPAATGVLMKNSSVRSALDLSAQWADLSTDNGLLVMGSVAARTEFVEEHPELVDIFLYEYGESIAYMRDETHEDAAQLCAGHGITPNAEVAAAALPQANLTFLVEDLMQETIQGYYEVLWQADPKSIGGSLPDDAFYYHYGA